MSFLQYINLEEGSYVVREIHWGICGIHVRPRMVVAKIVNVDYFLSRKQQSVVAELQSCMECQKHAPVSLRPKIDIIPVSFTWSFQR